MKRTLIRSVIMALILSVFFLPIQSFAATTSFKDLKKSHWAYDNIMKTVQKGYFVGFDDGTFKPENNVSRAQAITLIIRILNLEEDVSAYPFNDQGAKWAHGYIGAAHKHGILNKNDYGANFNPDRAITRAELAKWLSNALAYVNKEYGQAIHSTKDTLLPIPEYYTNRIKKEDIPYVAVMMGTGIMTGFENKEWRPNNSTTRAQMATVLLRLEDAMKKKPQDFFHLRELIAVGETGTNIEVTTVYRVARNEVFANVRNKPIDMRLGGGQLFVNRIIALDEPVNGKYKSIYANMFIGSKTKFIQKDYEIFVEKRLKATKPLDSDFFSKYYADRSLSWLLNGFNWDHGEEDLFGLNIQRRNENFEVFMKRINNAPYWENTYLNGEKTPGISPYTIETNDGSRFVITKKRE